MPTRERKPSAAICAADHFNNLCIVIKRLAGLNTTCNILNKLIHPVAQTKSSIVIPARAKHHQHVDINWGGVRIFV